MILAIFGAVLGLGAFAVLLHRLTMNALILFVALALAFASRNAGLGTAEALALAIVSSVLGYGLLVVLTCPGMPLALQLGARTVFALPAAAAAWFVALGLAGTGPSSGLLAYGFATIAAAAIGLRAWSGIGRTA